MDGIPDAFWVVTATLLGGIIGSFLNVCVYRLPLRTSIVWPGSRCTSCGRALAWFENIPVASWIVLGGRCRTCHARISWRYPLTEAITAAMFGLGWWFYGPGWLLVSRLLFGCALIVLFEIDLEHQLLPNAITVPGIAAGLAFSLVTEPGWQASLLGTVVGGGIILVFFYGYLWLRGQEGLGMGDFKMLAMIGAFVGWKLVLLTLALASITGSAVGLWLIATRRSSMASKLPFGTFLAVGAAAAATVGPRFLDWYVGLW
jgi:leader peptidase (prepilin peptidase)/N-methyltransferase